MLDVASQIASHFPLAYEPVALPCSLMKCGDVIYRSTLAKDPRVLDWKAVAAAVAGLTYLFVTPGVVPGLFDYYILAPWQRRDNKVYSKEDLIMGKRLGVGGFGSVFLAELKQGKGQPTMSVVAKKANEFGEAEVWMNERMTRVGGNHVADFVTAFADRASAGKKAGPADSDAVWLVWRLEGKNTLWDMMLANEFGEAEVWMNERMTRVGGNHVADFVTAFADRASAGKKAGPADSDAVWLVWRLEGKNTLWDMMLKKDWPYNLESQFFGRELNLQKGPSRRAAIIKEAAKQLIENVAACHTVGIVHRDIKPQNCIISEEDNKIKLIDLVPLGSQVCTPTAVHHEQADPHPATHPVATFLSPVLWMMEGPDKFDMYSIGIILMQMAFPSLRNDDKLIVFNRRFEAFNYDLRAWRANEQRKGVAKDDVEGFEVMDLERGAGWDLACNLLAFKPQDRLSAAQCLEHRFFSGAPDGSDLASKTTTAFPGLKMAGQALSKAIRAQGDALGDVVTREGSLSEAQLMEELGDVARAPAYDRDTSKTVAWFQKRQNEASRKLDEQQRSSQEASNNGSSSEPGIPSGRRQPLGTPVVLAGQRKSNGQRKNDANAKEAGKAKVGKGLGTPGSSPPKKFDLFGFLKPKS
ncbi:MAG: hypothetical protein WDW38_000680 [Sanguina aurantia]